MTIMKDVSNAAQVMLGHVVRGLILACCTLLASNVFAFVPVPLTVDFGLSTVYAAERPLVKGRPTVGVYKITADYADVSDVAIEALTSSIGSLSSVRTMERAKLRQAFSEEILRREGIVTAVRRGHALAPDLDYLILGDVRAYEQPWGGGWCYLTIRLVDCSHDIGNVVATIETCGSNVDGTWQHAVKRAAASAAKKLAAYWPAQGQVILQDGRLVYISLTSFDNIQKGDKVTIYSGGFDALNPATGKPVTIRRGAIRCKVIEVTQEYSVVEMKEQVSLKGGELVEWKIE